MNAAIIQEQKKLQHYLRSSAISQMLTRRSIHVDASTNKGTIEDQIQKDFNSMQYIYHFMGWFDLLLFERCSLFALPSPPSTHTLPTKWLHQGLPHFSIEDTLLLTLLNSIEDMCMIVPFKFNWRYVHY